jgi:acetyl esterase
MDEDARRILDIIAQSGRPPYETMTVDEARRVSRDGRKVVQPEPAAVAEIRDLRAPAPQGDIALRLYRGAGTDPGARLPALIYFHGGGWVLGDLDSHDVVCRRLANGARCAVVSVDYRLAPEHRFPAAVDDSISATRWIAAEAEALGIDGHRLAVGGDSAGGTLATVVALTARDEGGPALRYQLLTYPATDLGLGHASHRDFTSGLILTHGTMRWFRDLYLSAPADEADWRASPLRAATLAGLPPAYLLTVGYDPLLSEGEAYGERLAAAGVAVRHRHYPGQIHGFITMGKVIAAAEPAIDEAAAALGESLA